MYYAFTGCLQYPKMLSYTALLPRRNFPIGSSFILMSHKTWIHIMTQTEYPIVFTPDNKAKDQTYIRKTHFPWHLATFQIPRISLYCYTAVTLHKCGMIIMLLCLIKYIDGKLHNEGPIFCELNYLVFRQLNEPIPVFLHYTKNTVHVCNTCEQCAVLLVKLEAMLHFQDINLNRFVSLDGATGPINLFILTVWISLHLLCKTSLYYRKRCKQWILVCKSRTGELFITMITVKPLM